MNGIVSKNHTPSVGFWKELPGLHCMLGTTDGEKTRPPIAATSPTLLGSTVLVPSLILAVVGKTILLLKGETMDCTMPLLPARSSAPIMFLFVTSEAEGTLPRVILLGTTIPEVWEEVEGG